MDTDVLEEEKTTKSYLSLIYNAFRFICDYANMMVISLKDLIIII